MDCTRFSNTCVTAHILEIRYFRGKSMAWSMACTRPVIGYVESCTPYWVQIITGVNYSDYEYAEPRRGDLIRASTEAEIAAFQAACQTQIMDRGTQMLWQGHDMVTALTRGFIEAEANGD